jgi:type IV pilus assembly protein PilP
MNAIDPRLEPPRSARRAFLPLLVVGLGTVLIYAQGCGGNAPPPPPASAVAAVSAAPSASASASSSATAVSFNESDFTESESSRDPFHSYVRVFAPSQQTVQKVEYNVILEKYTVDELRLAAIINAGDGYTAMFIDPTGRGWSIKRGDHMCRGEIVKLGDKYQSSYPLYWKVDRIKETEVVLMREDSLHPEVPPTYREIPLHPEAEKT